MVVQGHKGRVDNDAKSDEQIDKRVEDDVGQKLKRARLQMTSDNLKKNRVEKEDRKSANCFDL